MIPAFAALTHAGDMSQVVAEMTFTLLHEAAPVTASEDGKYYMCNVISTAKARFEFQILYNKGSEKKLCY